MRLLIPTVVCLLAMVGAATRDVRKTTILRRVEPTTQRPRDFRSSPVDLGPRRLEDLADDNALLDGLRADGAGDGRDAVPKKNKKKKDEDDDDEDKKTLSQQIADGKYGLIQKEIYSRPSLRPGIISYKGNPEVPKDSDKNLGGLEAEEIWLAEDHVLVLRGGWYPNHSFNKTESTPLWPPIDDYNAPPRQVKIPAKPRVPPPFPVQLTEGGPAEFIGPNGTRSRFPPFFPPPQGNFPPGAGFYPPPGNGSLYPPLPPPYPFPPPRNGTFPSLGNFPPPGDFPPPPGRFQPPPGNYPYPPKDGPYPQLPYPPPPHGYMPFPNGSSPFGPLPPFLPPLPPGAAFLPPPSNQTEFDEDDPSIYYPPPYDFYYPRDNSTEVPPGPLVPGIILPPPPDFFAPLDEHKNRRPSRPPSASTTTSTTPQSYLPPSPRPTAGPHGSTTPPPDVAILEISTPLPPPTSTRPSAPKRPYLTYVPVTTAMRKKKPRPPATTTELYYEKNPIEFTTTPPPLYRPRPPPPAFDPRPGPPQFVQPQNVQVYHKGESPITSRPFYLDVDNVVTTPEPTPRPDYQLDGLSKLKDILYTTPRPTITYQLGKVIDLDAGVKPHYLSTVAPGKGAASPTTPSPLPAQQYDTDLTKRPIYVQNLDDPNDYTSTVKYPANDYEGNVVSPQRPGGNKVNGAFQPQRAPKTTYYFYEEPQFSQGYVRDITTSKPYPPQPWQYERRPPPPPPPPPVRLPRPQTPEEMLLAQIVETFRQPGGYTNQKPRLPPQNYYSSGGNGQNFFVSSRPNGFNLYSTPRPGPGFYVTRKPDYYSMLPSQSESPLKYNSYPFSFEDVVQSTEHPLPPPSRLKGPDNSVQTSPKTVYEFSFQSQTDSKPTFVTRPTERPRPAVHRPPPSPSFHPIRVQQQTYLPQPHRYQQYRQPPQQQPLQAYQEKPPQRTRHPAQSTLPPLPSNSVEAQYDQVTLPPKPKPKPTARPPRPPPPHAPTPDPLQHYYTQQDAGLLDDITKKYFTIFGQKLPAGGAQAGGITERLGTTPLPDLHDPVPLHNDILVNYLHPRPTLNPDSEFVDQGVEASAKGGELVSYRLPGNDGGHVFFVTPQAREDSAQGASGGYVYRRPRARQNNKSQHS